MKIHRDTRPDTPPGGPDRFAGVVHPRPLAETDGAAVYHVRFQAGARTHWHAHSGTQLLYVVEGRCLVQTWGGEIEVVETGDIAEFPAGEKHWHGADDAGPMTHVATLIGDARSTDWMEPVAG